MVILVGIILIVVSAIQIYQNNGTLFANLIFGALGLVEIVIAITMMRREKKNPDQSSSKR